MARAESYEIYAELIRLAGGRLGREGLARLTVGGNNNEMHVSSETGEVVVETILCNKYLKKKEKNGPERN